MGSLLHSMRLRRILVGFALAWPVPAAAVSAQGLRGGVRDSVSGQPIAGAVVQLVDGRDTVVARAVSGSDGRYRIPAATARIEVAPFHLRIRKIGFRARELAVGPDDTADLEILLAPLPTMLESVVSSATPGCRDNETTPRARELWHAARAAWLAGLAPEVLPEPALLVEDPIPGSPGAFGSQMVRTPAVAESFGVARHALEHYLITSERVATGDRHRTLAPAADSSSTDLLLDANFLMTHCVRVEGDDRQHRGETALRFVSPSGRSSAIDVEGRLWLDTTDAILRSVEFDYPVPHLRDRETARGRAVFATTTNGAAVITRWGLHLNAKIRRPPKGVRIIIPLGSGPRRDTLNATVLSNWDSVTDYEGSLPHLLGRVIDRATDRGMHGVAVSVEFAAALPDRRPRTVTTDSLGYFSVELPGTAVRLRAVDTAFAAFRPDELGRPPDVDWDVDRPLAGSAWDSPPWGTFIGVNASYDHDERAMIKVTSTADAYRDACHVRATNTTTGILVGRVDTARWRPTDEIPLALVHVAWRVSDGPDAVRNVMTDSSGRFRVCGIPRGAAVSVVLPPDTAGVRLGMRGDLLTAVVIGAEPRRKP